MISGLSFEEICEVMQPTSEVEVITEETTLNTVALSDEISNKITDDVIELMKKSEDSVKPKSTKDQEKYHMKKFETFLSSKNIAVDMTVVSESDLNNYLRWFYHENRKNDGGFYSPESLKCIRAASYMTVMKFENNS